MPFEHKMRVRFQDTDHAGIVFFANIFVYCHEAYEEMLRSLGMPLEQFIQSREQTLPLAHAEATFRKPFRAGVLVTIRVSLRRLGDRSFSLGYEMYDEASDHLASVTTVHVGVDPATGRSIPISPKLGAGLKTIEA